MKRVVFKHYKTGEQLEIRYNTVFDYPTSDKMVVYDIDKQKFMDIRKETIVEIVDE